MTNNLLDKFFSKLTNEALKSPIQCQLAAAILKDKKMVSKPCCNVNNSFRGKTCGSIHAEANAIINFFGKDLQFDRGRKRWYLK